MKKTMQQQRFFYQASDNAVLPETRWVAVFIIPFLIAAWFILYILPQQSGDLFAWPINPTMTARLMGSGYLAGAYFFLRVIQEKKWQRVKNGFLPVSIFAAVMALTTILHWDRFTPGHIAFITWVALYAITPFLVLAIWLRNRQADPNQLEQQDAVVPAWVRGMMAVVGLGILTACIYFYIRPEAIIAIWPWTLSPLTARSILGFFILPAITEIVLARDPRWSAHKIIIQGQIAALVLILFAAVLSWNEFTLPTGWIFVVGITLILIGNIAYHIWMQSRESK